ncbi:MAG: ABC transporter ATP-binding protein, partial [Oscillospiraceae bacterium]|nr:ABC transporter ATP-binding protein [Oscillospiraceae bacterium]
MSKSPKRLKNPADKYQKSKLSIFASFYKPHLNLFVLDMTCAFFVAAIDVAYPMITRFALNNLLPNKQFSEFFWLMAMLVLFYVIRSGLHYIITYWGHQLGVYIEAGMRSDLFNHLQRLSFKFYDQNRTGQIMSRMTTDLFDITELTHHCPEDIF